MYRFKYVLNFIFFKIEVILHVIRYRVVSPLDTFACCSDCQLRY